MTVPAIDGAEDLDVRRGDVVVVMAAGGRAEAFVTSLHSVLAHSDSAPVLVHGPAGAAATVARVAADGGGRDRVRFLAGAATAVAASAPADVVLLGAGAAVGPEWLTRLRAAAEGDACVATASALSADLIDHEVGPGPIEDVAARVAAAARQSHPRLRAPCDACVYVRRAAIELIGDPTAPGFAAACLAAGLLHVLADDVLIAPADGPAPSLAAEGAPEPVMHALGTARRALRPLQVLIDARILAGALDGTRVHVTELVAAVAGTHEVEVSVLVSDRLGEPARAALQRVAGVRLVTPEAAARRGDGGIRRADVVHRPHQIANPADLAVLSALGERLVITHQDLISFHNPAYFPSGDAWRGYRDLTRRALGAADRVLFFSEHVRGDALREELVDPSRAEVVRIGVDHALTGAPPESAPPAAEEALSAGAEMMLCLGNDFRHKNRVFALRLLDELQRRHAWPGRLVLAGPRVTYGSSRDAEQALLVANPALADAVVGLDDVSDAEREWLLARAALVLYPTIAEGFGLVPYEAAARGVPCLWAAGTALSELLPDDAAAIVAWDAAATAKSAVELMRDDAARARNVAAVREAGAALSWRETGRRLVDVYRTACEQPMNPAAAIERSSGLMSGGLSEDAMRLVGPDGVLPRELERPLLAVFARPALARVAAGALRAGYRLSRRRGR